MCLNIKTCVLEKLQARKVKVYCYNWLYYTFPAADCKFRPIRKLVSVGGKFKVDRDKNYVDSLGRCV